jgi:succinate dehydrogenase / fumarate reductase membrane anchor subunit
MQESKSPLGQVKHLGSARSGTEHFIRQRVTAVFLIPLMVWFVVSLMCMVKSPEQTPEFIASPWTMFLSVFFSGTILYHGYLGMQTIMEDYIHCKYLRNFMLLSLLAICIITFIGTCVTFFGLHFIYLIKN